jgi:hypothetical protein
MAQTLLSLATWSPSTSIGLGLNENARNTFDTNSRRMADTLAANKSN